MLRLKDYKYKELCEELGEKTKDGNAKVAQVNRWKGELFNWVHPVDSKHPNGDNRTFRVLEIYDVKKEYDNGHGGKRKNAGAKSRINGEFNYLFNCFLHYHWNMNAYNARGDSRVAYFTNSHIMEYFGVRRKNFYKAKEDDSVRKSVFNKVSAKINEKLRSWIIDKIKAVDGVELSYGIIAYKDKQKQRFDYRNDFLEKWNARSEMYLDANGLKNISEAVDRDLYNDMIYYISLDFSGYHSVYRVHKVDFSGYDLQEYEVGDIEEHRKNFNRKIVRSLLEYFKKEYPDSFQEYKDVINKYVMI